MDNPDYHEPLHDLQEGSCKASTSTPWTTSCRSGKPWESFRLRGNRLCRPVLVKYGPVQKPRFMKGYVAVFVCLATKAVHLELVSDLTTSACIATLRRFIGQCGIPFMIWSDHRTNFVGAEREIQVLLRQDERSAWAIAGFCTYQQIKWKFIPERTPHFRGYGRLPSRALSPT